MNRFELTEARLTRDPEVKYAPTQTAFCNLVVAVDTGYGEKKRTDFPRITVFGKDAENLDRLSGKGLRVNIFGRIQTRSYEKDGKTTYMTDLIADRIEFVDYKPKDEFTPNEFKGIDGDIPF